MKWLLLFILICLPAYADRVLYCQDGDTCKVEKDGKTFNARFYGIDAPELNQPYGQESRDLLKNLLIGKEVRVTCMGKLLKGKTCDFYANGQDVSALMVRNGLAWDCPQASRGKYTWLQAEAKRAHRGIWATRQESPYCYKHKNKTECEWNRQYQP